MKGRKNCWVTAAVDETSAKEAVVLARSISRSVTEADTIVFIPMDFPDIMGKMLAEYFNVVINVHIGSVALPVKDCLKMHSWNLTMYSKCIYVESKTMVLKNCDDLFNFEFENAEIAINKIGKTLDTGAFIIKPQAQNFRTLFKLSISKKYNNLSETLNEYLRSSETRNYVEIPGTYSLLKSTSTGPLDEVKIVTLHAADLLHEQDDHRLENTSVQQFLQIWERSWDDTLSEIYSNTTLNIRNGMLPKAEPQLKHRVYQQDEIAVIGHSCRFPASNNIDEFWDLLITAGDGIIPCPVERLTDSQRGDPKYTESRGGFLKCPIDEFDAKFFGISPREAAFMDPQQRLLVEVAWEALENAAIDPHSLKGSNTGVFSGVWTHDYEHLINETITSHDFHHVVLGNAFSATSARVSFFLGLNGPNVATESGCSSSMVGLHLACESLKRHETDLNLVLGAHIMINQFSLQEIPILAKDGHCKTFDEKADGFGRAEGVAVVVLKRLSDAIKDNDRIMGIIRGTAMSNEGTSSNFGTPSRLCQEIAIKEAIRVAGVQPGEVDYVEAHGTGTPVGDPIEFAALSAGYNGERDKPLLIGSVKTNTGHTESASGLAGLIKVMLAMKHEVIPPHRNFDNLNPNINLDFLPAEIPLESREWPRNDERVRIAGISSFGISGTNVHAILEEPPTDSYLESCKLSPLDSDRSHHILTLSAKTENALKDLSDRYCQYFEQNPNVNVSDVAFTANTGKAHLKYRQFVVGKSISELQSNLKSNEFTAHAPLKNVPNPKVGFLFTGQGSQYFDMGKELYGSNLVFRNAFIECSSLVQNNVTDFSSLADALWNESKSNLLDETIYSQLSIFCVEYSLLKLWESLGVKPDFVLGHSVGEFAAATAAGILTLEEAICLLSERSKLIHQLPPGGMLAVRCSQEIILKYFEEFLGNDSKGWLDIAVVNSPHDVVVAGNNETVLLFKEFCLQKGKVCHMLAASHAFHSRAMEGAVDKFGNFANTIGYKSPKCCYISGTTGEILNSPMNGAYWQKHARETVNFSKGMKTLAETDCNVFIEIGAHPVLLALGMNNVSNSSDYLWLPSIRRNENNWKTFLASCGNLYSNNFTVKWEALDKSFARKKLELPSYPFQRQKYWMESSREALSKILHPLLGRKLMLADVKYFVYENTWNMKTLQYLHDHQVSNITVLPGAGFLEIILAAGNDIFSFEKIKSTKILKVEDFMIESPLELKEEMRQKIQVVASPVENEGNENKFLVKVFMYKNLNGYNDEKGWKQYSSALVCLSNENYSEFSEQGNITISTDCKKTPNISYTCEDLQTIKSRCPTEGDSKEFYKLAPQIGIYFGETFQSIESVWEGNQEALAKIPLPSSKAGNFSTYIYHPIVLDAMIQIFGLSVGKENADLFLPVGINNFTMFTDTKEILNSSKCFYAHAKWEQPGKPLGTVALYNEKNILLGVMNGVRLLQTTANSFLNVINAGNNMLPGMYQEVWRIRDGPLQSRVNLTKISSDLEIFPNIEYEYLLVPEIEALVDEWLCLEIIRGFLVSGWNPKVSALFSAESVMQDLLISYKFSSFVDRLLEIIWEDGYSIEIHMGNSESCKQWKLIKLFPPLNAITKKQENISNIIDAAYKNTKYVTHDISFRAAKKLIDVLQGNLSAEEAVFGSKDINPLDVYTKSADSVMANILTAEYLTVAFQELKTGGKQEGCIVRILEIGAGSGATSLEIIKHFQTAGIPFRYTFTDSSPQILESAKSGALSAFSGIDYQTLHIEKDPSGQGYCPWHYDVIVASNVIHATEHLKTSVQNVRKLLAPNGLFLMQEMLKPVRSIDVIFGVLDDFWKFNDYEIRKSHPLVSKSVWNEILNNNGLEISLCSAKLNRNEKTSLIVAREKCSIEHSILLSKLLSSEKSPAWILFSDNGIISEDLSSKLLKSSENVIKIVHDVKKDKKDTCNSFYVDLADADEIYNALSTIYVEHEIKGIIYLHPLQQLDELNAIYLHTLNVCKYFTSNIISKVVFCLVTRGALWTHNQENGSPFKTPVVGMIKSLANEVREIELKLVDLDPDNINEEADSQEIFFELFSLNESIVSFRNRKKFVSRMVTFAKPMAPLALPLGRYTIEIPKSRKIDDVSFKGKGIGEGGEFILKPDEIEVLVKATALNFRDIFVILKPDTFQSAFEAVGTDLSGIVTKIGSKVHRHKVGDEVFGISNASSAASHVIVDNRMVLQKPKHYTFAEASTLPSVFFTAWHCLLDVANLKAEDTILIHVASGGVGLVVIQIAQHIGAKIIATAGSHRKRSYLKSIGVEHVFNSRDLTYEKKIHETTEGRGVDVVLNSLTGPGFVESSLKICAHQARFVEMAKVNIWSPENIHKLRPDVNYTIVDLEKVDRSGIVHLLNKMEECIDQNVISPLPFSRFEIAQTRDALNYFLKSQHIGKVILTMPEMQDKNGIQFHKELLFNCNGTYLITGGLGGIGLEVAKWMVDCGTKNLVLVGRSPPTVQAAKIIANLKSIGCRILSLQFDVGCKTQCQKLFGTISNSKLPPLRGVIHSAGVLSDAVYANQTWEKYQTVFNSKINGAWNLHELTKDLVLEHFVLFSSLCAWLCAVGQSNYAAANMFLDSLAHYRHSMGLPAQTINWGPWSEVGAATNTAFGNEGAFGIKPFTPTQGIAALKFLMNRPNLVQLGVMQLNIIEMKESMFLNPGLMSQFDAEICESESTPVHSAAQAEQFLKEISSKSFDERVIYIKSILETIVRKTLKLPSTEPIDEYQKFSELGLDSLMAVEMKNKLQTFVGKSVTLNATSLLDYPSISELCKYLAQETMSVQGSDAQQENKSTTNKNSDIALVKQDLIVQDSILPDDIQVASSKECVPIGETKCVLLTGSTGQIGVHILKDLLEIPSIEKIFCLIRGKDAKHAGKKLNATLKKYQLSVNLDKVVVVVGNIAVNRLGLVQEEYDALSDKIDCVFHFAAKVNQVENYKVTKSNIDIRSANVHGTVNVIRFCSNIKTKRLVYASTYTAINRLTSDGFAYEEFPDDENFGDGITVGYIISKFIGEKLVKEGYDRGIPTTAIRYPAIVGNSVSGHFTVETNFLMNIALSSSRLGMFPDIKGAWNCLPVDIASQLTMELVFNENSELGMFNLFHTVPMYSRDIVEAANHSGYNLKLVSEDEYFKAFVKESETNSFFAMYTEAFGKDFRTALSMTSNTLATSLTSGTNIFRYTDKFLNVIPNVQNKIPNTQSMLLSFFKYANRSGISEKFGIKLS